jgi:mRNA-degrading endonuclease RelE of RelBE toxin-antitoxin system
LPWIIKYTESAQRQRKKLDKAAALRVICDIQDQTVVILVIAIGHRREVYRGR